MPRALRIAVDLLAFAVAIFVVARLVPVFSARLFHPADLEWMEGGMLAHAWRIQRGMPIYTEPTPEWIPFLYPPGYATVLAAAGSVFGLDWWVGRAISLTGTVLAGLALPFATWRHGRDLLPGVLAFAALLGLFPNGGAFYDLVRLDGLYLALFAWASVIGLERGERAAVASGLLLAAAFLVKQHAALFGLPLVALFWARDGRRAALGFALSAAVPALTVTLLLQWWTSGYYLTYILGVPSVHGYVGDRIWPGTPRELVDAAAPLLPVMLGFLAWRAREGLSGVHPGALYGVPIGCAFVAASVEAAFPAMAGLPIWQSVPGVALFGALLGLGAVVAVARAADRDLAFALGFGAMTLFTCGMMRGHVGGFLNVQIPMFWGALLGGALIAALVADERVRLALRVAWIAQLVWVAQEEVERFRPAPGAAEGVAALVEVLKEAPGPVYSPYGPWYAALAGHEPGVHLIAVWDLDHRGGPFDDVGKRLSNAAKQHHFGALVIGPKPLQFGMEAHYPELRRFPKATEALMPRSGWRARPMGVRTVAPLPRKETR